MLHLLSGFYWRSHTSKINSVAGRSSWCHPRCVYSIMWGFHLCPSLQWLIWYPRSLLHPWYGKQFVVSAWSLSLCRIFLFQEQGAISLPCPVLFCPGFTESTLILSCYFRPPSLQYHLFSRNFFITIQLCCGKAFSNRLWDRVSQRSIHSKCLVRLLSFTSECFLLGMCAALRRQRAW